MLVTKCLFYPPYRIALVLSPEAVENKLKYKYNCNAIANAKMLSGCKGLL